MGTSGGEIQSAFNSLRSCWADYVGLADTGTDDELWKLTLPVVDCPDNNVSPCSTMVGAVTLNVVWITGNGNDPDYFEVPREHAGWVSDYDNDYDNGSARWDDFAQHFNLKNKVDGVEDWAPYQKKALYFLPECDVQYPKGGTGGKNFGILAQVPVLVD
jgi:hypothetical protein